LSKGLIIISHGSRSRDAVTAFHQIIDMVREKGSFDHVVGAFMEHNEPSIPEAIAEVIAAGAEEIVFAPYFLYEGMHIKEDIPQILHQVFLNYPGVSYKLARPIGVEPVLADIILDRALAVK
jgi:sirohydrochlorin ferrochelatase